MTEDEGPSIPHKERVVSSIAEYRQEMSNTENMTTQPFEYRVKKSKLIETANHLVILDFFHQYLITVGNHVRLLSGL